MLASSLRICSTDDSIQTSPCSMRTPSKSAQRVHVREHDCTPKHRNLHHSGLWGGGVLPTEQIWYQVREGFCKVLRRGGEGALEIFPCSACLPAWLSSTCPRPERQMDTLRGKPAAAVILRVLFPVGYLRNHSNTPTGTVTSFARAFFTRS